MRELTALRQEIDQLDSQIAQLFLQRMEVCREVGEYKKANGTMTSTMHGVRTPAWRELNISKGN